MKKLFLLIPLFILFLFHVPSVFATTGTFTLDTLQNSLTNIPNLSFTTSNFNPSTPFNACYIQIHNASSNNYYMANSLGNAGGSSCNQTGGFANNYGINIPDGNYYVNLCALDSNNQATGDCWISQTFALSNGVLVPLPTATPTPSPTPTPTPTPTAQLIMSPASNTVTVGTPFTVNITVSDTGQAFNAVKSSVSVSSNLSIVSINNATTNPCNLNYTKQPTTSDPSFAGAIFGSSSTGCNVYTMSLQPNAPGAATITFNNSSIKAYADSSELLTGVTNGSYTINAAAPTPTPPGTTLVAVDDSVQGTGQNQWDYVGAWSHCTDTSNPACNPNLYNNSVSWNNTTDDYTTLTFTGRQVLLYGLTDPNHGIAGVSIDAGTETNVDFYSVARTGDVLLWTSPLLAPGQHTLKVRVTGTKNANSSGTYLALDRADIVGTIPSNLTVTNTVFATYGPTYTLTGTKDSSITTVFVNGSSSNVTYPTSTTWQAVEPVSLGNNSFVVYGTDSNNVQTSSINVLVNMHTLGDINGDGVVDLTDASLFAVDYGKTSNLTYPLSDMNGDGSADLTDLSILAKLEQ